MSKINLTIKQGTNIDNMFKNCFECNATLICKYSTVLHMLDEHAKYVFTCANKGPSEWDKGPSEGDKIYILTLQRNGKENTMTITNVVAY